MGSGKPEDFLPQHCSVNGNSEIITDNIISHLLFIIQNKGEAQLVLNLF